jgi:ribonuclease P protein component
VRFRPHQKLLHKAEFDRVFAAGRRGFGPGLLVFLADSRAPNSRLGLSVSRRFGKAVARNRARRLLREAFRLSEAELPQSFDIVALPRDSKFPDQLAAVCLALHQAVRQAQRRPARRSKSDRK